MNAETALSLDLRGESALVAADDGQVPAVTPARGGLLLEGGMRRSARLVADRGR